MPREWRREEYLSVRKLISCIIEGIEVRKGGENEGEGRGLGGGNWNWKSGGDGE